MDDLTKNQIDQMLESLRDERERGAEGAMTTREVADMMGCGTQKARRTIRELVGAGRMKPCQVPRKSVTGVTQKVWAYQVVEEAA